MEKTKRAVRTASLFLAVVALIGTGGWVLSVFSGAATNSGNSVAAGSVALGLDQSGSAVFNATGWMPGDGQSRCIDVTYTGSVGATVRLYADATTTNLAQYLDMTMTRGTGAGVACGSFSADATDYLGSGNGVIYSGTLANYLTTYGSYANGLHDPKVGSEATWASGNDHVYRITLTLQDNNAAQGLAVSGLNFSWEAR